MNTTLRITSGGTPRNEQNHFPDLDIKNFYNLVQYFPQGDLMIDLVLQVLRQFCLIYSFTHPNPKYCPLQ